MRKRCVMRRRTPQLLAAFILGFVLAVVGRAGEGEAASIIDKAVKAHFPKGLDTKNKGLRSKNKGMLHVAGLDLEFTQEVSVEMPTKFKEVMQLTVMNKNINVTTVFNGKEGWILADGKDVKVT